MRQNTLLVALSAVAVAAAQNSSSTFTINPSEVKPSDRTDWCNAEYNTCGILCGGNPTANDCDPNTLTYICTCTNGTAPGLQYYIQTMPTFICEQAYSDCIAANTASSKAQDQCKVTIKSQCGTLDPAKAQIGSSSGTTSAAASGATSKAATSTAGQAAATTSSKAAAAPTNIAYLANGVAAVAAGVFAVLL